MSNLPMDRTKLNAAIANQQPSVIASSKANREALIETADTIDLLNQKVDGLVNSGTLSPSPPNFMSRQALINGNFDVWQRGTSFTSPNPSVYLADRWQNYLGSAGTLPTSIIHSRQTLVPGDIPGSNYFYRVSPNGSGSGFGTNDVNQIAQKIENGTRYLAGVGKKVTVSFLARSSIVGKRLGISLQQYYGSGGTPTSPENINGTAYTLTSTWTKYTFTFTTNTLVGKTFGTNNDDILILFFGLMWGSTYVPIFNSGTTETFVGAGDIDIAQVQLCAGDTALPFQPRSFADELILCQRYFEKSYDYGTTIGTITGNGFFRYQTRKAISASTSGSIDIGKIGFNVRKRIPPTMKLYSTNGPSGAVRVMDGGDRIGATSSNVGESGFASVSFDNTSPTAINLDNYIDFHWTADASF